MAFLNPTRHFHKANLELLILMTALVLFVLALIAMAIREATPLERAVPLPVIAEQSVPVHFSKLQGSQSITEPVLRQAQITQSNPSLKVALQELLEGPSPAEKEAGYYSEIPANTQLLGVQEENGTVTINLSKEFTSGGGSTSMLQRVEELRQTVQSVHKPVNIQLAIEGKPLKTLGGEGLELN